MNKFIKSAALAAVLVAAAASAQASTYTFGTGYPHSVTGPSGNTVDFGRAPISEAGTLSMMVAGLALLGLRLRRNRK